MARRGNIFIRRTPAGKTELVLIDHGLYINMDPEFRHKYALLWKSLMTFDNKTIKDVVSSWGVGNSEIFASATLLRPYSGGDQSVSDSIKKGLEGKTESERAYEMQQKMRQGIKQMLTDQDKFPRELLFIGRNLRIVQGNNQYMGSPVNRIKLTGMWASRALVDNPDLSLTERARFFGGHVLFRTVLFGSDVYFWYAKVKQWLGLGGGMEDELENQMRTMAKGFGVELQHDVFDG
jgi:aarF domain-containing kinase